MVQRSVTGGPVAVPCIIIKGICLVVDVAFVRSREDDLGADDTPSCAALRGCRELFVEPVLLARAHE